jgi:hypothetical protein
MGVSVLIPNTWVSRAANSASWRPNSAISVGHTNVKSIGQKKSTRHFPGGSRG